MVDAARFRLVALFACWSSDDWLDLRAAQRGMVLRGTAPAGKAGPSDWELILAARFDARPSEVQVAAALDAASTGMLDCDGHAVLHSFRVVGEAEWRQLAEGRAAEVDALPDGHPHRLVASYGSLGAALSVLPAVGRAAEVASQPGTATRPAPTQGWGPAVRGTAEANPTRGGRTTAPGCRLASHPR